MTSDRYTATFLNDCPCDLFMVIAEALKTDGVEVGMGFFLIVVDMS